MCHHPPPPPGVTTANRGAVWVRTSHLTTDPQSTPPPRAQPPPPIIDNHHTIIVPPANGDKACPIQILKGGAVTRTSAQRPAWGGAGRGGRHVAATWRVADLPSPLPPPPTPSEGVSATDLGEMRPDGGRAPSRELSLPLIIPWGWVSPDGVELAICGENRLRAAEEKGV